MLSRCGTIASYSPSLRAQRRSEAMTKASYSGPFKILNTPFAITTQRSSTSTSVLMKIRLRVAHHAGAGHQDVADLARFDEMRVELHGRHELLASLVAGGHAAGAVGESHHHAALDHAAAVVVLVLGRQREFIMAVDLALPERTDQMDEAAGVDDRPAVGFELCGGLRSSYSPSVLATLLSPRFIRCGPGVVKHHESFRRCHQTEYRRGLRLIPAAAGRSRAAGIEARRGGAGADRNPATVTTPRSCSPSVHRPCARIAVSGRCRADAAMPARRRSRRRCANSRKSSRSSSRADAVLGLLDDYPTRSGYLITPVVVWAAAARRSRRTRTRSPPSTASHLRRSARRRLRFHRNSRERRRVIRFPSPDEPDPRADGGPDLPVPRSAGGPAHPRYGPGTAGICLEVTQRRKEVNGTLT